MQRGLIEKRPGHNPREIEKAERYPNWLQNTPLKANESYHEPEGPACDVIIARYDALAANQRNARPTSIGGLSEVEVYMPRRKFTSNVLEMLNAFDRISTLGIADFHGKEDVFVLKKPEKMNNWKKNTVNLLCRMST